MKKLLLILTVLACGIGQVRATDVNIYIKPFSEFSNDAKLGLYMWNDTENGLALFSVTTTSNVYKAVLDSKYTNMLIVRLKPEASTLGDGWSNVNNKSGNMGAPSKDSYYDFSSAGWSSTGGWEKNGSSNYAPSVTKTVEKPYYLYGEHDIMPSYKGWTADTNTQMTDNGNLTFSKTVTGNLIGADTYEYIIKDGSGNWIKNGGNNFSFAITPAGTYTIEYTYNLMTGAVTATPTKTADTAPTYKFNVWCQDASSVDAIITNGWDHNDNLMTVTDGVASKTYSNQDLTAQEYKYKIVKRSFDGETKLFESWIGDDSGNNKTFTISKASTYNVTFSYTIASKTPSDTEVEQFTGYYIVGGAGEWSVGDALDASGNDYSITLSNQPNYRFAIVPNTLISAENTVTNYDAIIRPGETGNGGADDYWVSFLNYSAQPTTTSKYGVGQAWKIADINNSDVVFTYHKDTGKCDITCSKTVNISALGYATFSADYAVAIPDGVSAYYASSADAVTDKVTMTKFTNGIAASTGAMLYKASGGDVTFTPATTTDDVATTNLLKPTTGGEIYDGGKAQYILSKKKEGDASTIAFRKLTASYAPAKGNAYLEVASALAPSLSIVFDGEDDMTTGIDAIEHGTLNIEHYYNLAGQRVSKPTKGLYIVNGKKVVIK